MLLGGTVVILTLFYASNLYWDADRSYGPRYLVPLLPFLCLPLAPWFDLRPASARRRLLLAVVLLTVLAQAPGVLVDFSKAGYRPEQAHLNYQRRLWTWEGSGFTLNEQEAARLIPLNVEYLAGTRPRPAIRSAEYKATDFAEQFAFSLDFWWLYLFHTRAITAPVALAAFGALVLVAGALGLTLWTRSGRPSGSICRSRARA